VDEDRGNLLLVFESPARNVLNSPDNICVSPRGGVVICEDAGGEQFIRGLSAKGEIFDLVHQPLMEGGAAVTEFAGSCFSPDGDILFFNIQGGTRTAAGACANTSGSDVCRLDLLRCCAGRPPLPPRCPA
jgi:secreted PhoX family phosphatase